MRPATTKGFSVSTNSAEARNDRAGRACGGSISGKWTEEGLVYGRETLPGKGDVYEGHYRKGKREGRGRLELTDGSKFEGVMRIYEMCYLFPLLPVFRPVLGSTPGWGLYNSPPSLAIYLHPYPADF